MSENKFETPSADQPESAEKIPMTQEEIEQHLAEIGELFEKMRVDAEELEKEIEQEKDEVKKQEKIDLLAHLKQQLEEWDTDYQPATKEEELVITKRPYISKKEDG